jgi:hypothetical protein
MKLTFYVGECVITEPATCQVVTRRLVRVMVRPVCLEDKGVGYKRRLRPGHEGPS